jgi:hypothetical protein
MKHLRPESLDVYAVYVLSWGFEEELETPRTRRFLLGLFDTSVTEASIYAALEDHSVKHLVAGAQSVSSQGPIKIGIIPRKITEGVIFDSADEACSLLATGVSYEDILAGYALSATEDLF